MDIERTRKFYGQTLGLPVLSESDSLLVFAVGKAFIAFKKAEPRTTSGAVFSPFVVGLDHIALACESEEQLHRFADGLKEAGIENTGVRLDSFSQKLYVAFKDPDRIQWEFYMI